MATFDQKIQPINAPAYGSNSRPVELAQGIKPQGVETNQIMPHGVMQGDTSAAYAGEAAAAGIKADAVGQSQYVDLFKNIASTADFFGKAGVSLVKKDIEDKVYAVADRERQAYTDALEQIKNSTGVTGILEANTSGDGTSDATSPAEVAALPDTLSALTGARDAGKISSSYYQSRLLAEAKNLRAQYPGFKAEIDQEFAKVTGSNPANAYIHALVQDINRANSSKNTEQNRMLSYIQAHDKYPGSQKMYRDVLSGRAGLMDVFQWAAPYAQQEYIYHVKDLAHKDAANTNEDRARTAGDAFDHLAGAAVNQTADTIMGAMGLNTAADVDRLKSLDLSGAIKPTDYQAYGQRINDAKAFIANKLTAEADAKGYTKDLGGKEELNKRIAAALKPLDALSDRVYNHDFGGLYNVQQQLKAQNDITKQSITNDPKMGPYWQVIQATKDLGGEQNLQRFNLDIIKGNFSKDWQSWFGNFAANMSSQYNMRTSGIPYTFNDAIDHLKANKVSDAKLNNAVLNEVKKIYDPSVPEPIRMNWAKGAFSPGNRGMISRLSADGTDAKGNPVTGQTAVFQRFTMPDMTKAMHDLGKKEPQLWDNYVTWAKETFANELMSHELQNLGKIPPESGVTVGWDPVNSRLIPPQKYPDPSSKSYAGDQAWYNYATGVVNRINGNMSNLKNITKLTGEDPNAFLLKTIADNAGSEALQNVNGIPYNIIRSIGLGKFRDPSLGATGQ